MKIAAVLGVKDEVDIIPASIAHLRAIGVDLIAVSDFGSTDGTLDVLAGERRCGDLTVTQVDPGNVYDYVSGSAHDMAEAQRTEADWVLYLDADEFFVPAGGSLRHCRQLKQADLLVVDRYNVVTTTSHLLMPVDLSPANYDSLRLFTRQVDDFRFFVDARPDVPFITVQPGPKMLVRREAVRAMAPGQHDALAGGSGVRRAVAQDIIVAHVPFSTLRRFERKVANIRGEVVLHPRYFDNGFAWHWRRWAEMTAPGAIEQEFGRQLTGADELRRMALDGVIRSAADLFAERLASAVEPRSSRLAKWRDRLRRPAATLRPVDPGLADLPAQV